MARAKFQLGDKARLSSRVPAYIMEDVDRMRSRTIVSVRYDSRIQACWYALGGNHKARGLTTYEFRSYELVKLDQQALTVLGRPKSKRHYVKHNTLHNVNLGRKIPEKRINGQEIASFLKRDI